MRLLPLLRTRQGAADAWKRYWPILSIFLWSIVPTTVFGQSVAISGFPNQLGATLPASSANAPFEFIENRGQLSDQFQRAMPEVRYYAESHGVRTYFTKNSQHFIFTKVEKKTEMSGHDSLLGANKNLSLYRADMSFIGASPSAALRGEDQRDDFSNFYLASCPNGLANVPAFRSICYSNLYPNIDLVVRADGSNAKYEFIVHPGGRVDDIRMQYDDRERISVSPDGALHVSNSFGEISDPKPISAQLDRAIESGFVVSRNVVTYQVAAYDSTRDLSIDPPRLWGTYYGGTGSDDGVAVACDPSGNVYMTGTTTSSYGIATSGAFQTTWAAYNDIYLVKFNSAGVRQWGTYAGNGYDYPSSIVVDRNGDIVIAGTTGSYTAISTTGAYQTVFGGQSDAFLMKFTSAGARTWGTYYGSIGWDRGFAVGVDASNNILLGGTVNGYNNYGNCLVAKLNSAGSTLAWATTWGGHDPVSGDAVLGLTCDASNNVYVTGAVNSATSFATSGSHQTALGGNTDAFVAKLSSSGSISWCTYYGGSGYEYGYGIATDGSNLYTTGWTSSSSAIATSGAFLTSFTGPNEAYLTKWSYTGSLVWGTYYGGGYEAGNAIAIDSNADILFCGSTGSSSGIATTGEYQTTYVNHGTQNAMAFLTRFDASGSRLWGTYYGTGDEEIPHGLAIDLSSNVLMSGYTATTTGSLATAGAAQTSPGGGGQDAFLVKFCGIQTPTVSSTSGTSVCQGSSTSLSVSSGYSSYQWKIAGTDISGASSNTYAVPTTLTPGVYNYSIAVTNTTGCTTVSPTAILTVNANPTASPGTNHTICLGDSIAIGGVATGGQSPYTYAWTPSTGLSSATAASPKASPATTTTYSVIATDNNGCQGIGTVTVTVNPVPALSLIRRVETCAGTAVTIGSAASGSLAPYSYSWTPSAGLSSTSISQPNANPASETKYFVTVTDGNTCHAYDSVDVVVNPVPILSTSGNVGICLGSSAQLTSNTSSGTGTLTYAWTPATGLSSTTLPNPVASPAVTTTYQVTVTDSKGCSATKNLTVAVNKHPIPQILPGGAINLCAGDTVTLSTLDPYISYSWSTGATSSSIPVTDAGSYTVSVIDPNGCDGSSSPAIVTVHPRPLAAIAGPNAACPNSTDRYAAQSQSGVQYLWTLSGGGSISSGSTDSVCVVQWTAVGSWKLSLQVSDPATNCTKDTSYNITINSVLTPTLALSGPTTICSGDSVIMTAPVGYTTYKWSSGQTTNSIAVNQSGTYSVQVTNASGCGGTSQPVTVQVLPTTKPTPIVTAASSTICDGDSVLLTATSGYSGYMWSDGTAAPSLYVRKSGTYSVTATNASGCQGISPGVTIAVLPSPPVSVSASGVTTICEGGVVTLSASPGFSKYVWSNGATTSSIEASSTASYSVTVKNVNGCVRTSAPIPVTVVAKPNPSISGPVAACANSTQTYAVVNLAGSATQWRITGGTIQGGQGTNTITVLWGVVGAGTVNADQTITAAGCEGSATTLSVSIGTSLKPVINSAGNRTALCGAMDSIVLDAGGGYAHYTWSSGQTTQLITVGATGSYTVLVDDGAGCSGTSDPIVITTAQPPQPTVQSNGPLAFCEGDSVTLDAGAVYPSYAWNNNGTMIAGETHRTLTVRQSGVYAVDVTNAAGCTGTSAVTTVTVNALPSQPSITESNGVLSSSPANAYQWSAGGTPITGATSKTFEPTASGVYAVTITDANGCERSSLPYTLANAGATLIGVPALLFAQQGNHVTLPLTILSSQDLPQGIARDFIAVLRFNKTLLFPQGSYTSVVQGNDLVVTVTGTTSATNGVLTNLDLIAALGDDSCTTVIIDSFAWRTGSIQSATQNGTFCLSNLCEQGGTRLINPMGTFSLSIARPDPVSDAVQIDYQILEPGRATLTLYDVLGHPVLPLVDADLAPGKYSVVADLRSLPAGNYLYMLRSQQERMSHQLRIVH